MTIAITAAEIADITKRPDLKSQTLKAAAAESRALHERAFFQKDLVQFDFPIVGATSGDNNVLAPLHPPTYAVDEGTEPIPAGTATQIRKIVICRASNASNDVKLTCTDPLKEVNYVDRWAGQMTPPSNRYYQAGAHFRILTEFIPTKLNILYYSYPEILNSELDWMASHYFELLRVRTARRILLQVGRDKEASALGDQIQSLEHTLFMQEEAEEIAL